MVRFHCSEVLEQTKLVIERSVVAYSWDRGVDCKGAQGNFLG